MTNPPDYPSEAEIEVTIAKAMYEHQRKSNHWWSPWDDLPFDSPNSAHRTWLELARVAAAVRQAERKEVMPNENSVKYDGPQSRNDTPPRESDERFAGHTPRPWVGFVDRRDDGEVYSIFPAGQSGEIATGIRNSADADLLRAAPDLAAENARLRSERDKLRQAVADSISYHDEIGADLGRSMEARVNRWRAALAQRDEASK